MSNLTTTDYQGFIEQAAESSSQLPLVGDVASYIPQLVEVDPTCFGVHLRTVDGRQFGYGDSEQLFSIQSITKVLSLTLAFKNLGAKLWRRVSVEPSGSPFNSLGQLQYEKGIPRNPFINSGAIVICDVLVGLYDDPLTALLSFVRQLSGNESVGVNEAVAASEKAHAYRNLALANLMKDLGNIDNDIDSVLDLYFSLCAIEMSCKDLAQTFAFLAHHGTNPLNQEQVLTTSEAKRINAIMQTCGFYDEAGEFSYRVGLPGKSGVGGGIIAVHPGQFSIAVWSPPLNKKGNSERGMKFLEAFTTVSQSSIF